LSETERERIARGAFKAFCRGFIDRAVLWWAPPERIKRMVRVEGIEHLDAAGARVVILAPHFAGVEAGGLRVSIDRDLSTLYQHQKDPAFDRVLLKGRTRFRSNIVSRQEGLRRVLRWIKSGIPFYYLPDLDFGRKGTVFVPFFGVPASTAIGLSYIARTTGAAVVPCVTRMLPAGGYVAQFYPAWSDFPSGDQTADARRMMAFVEARVREMPEQYHWLHKRFKTRPDGEARFY
jgi:KDO2-lipid IV(A) lauroyltransferase